MLPTKLILTIAPMLFLNEKGKQYPIYSIRIQGIQNVKNLITLSANNAEICLKKCENVNVKQYLPSPSGILAFYTPIPKDNKWLSFKLTIDNQLYEIHPHGTAIANLVYQNKIPVHLKQEMSVLNQFHKHNNTRHLSKRCKHTHLHKSLQYQDHDPVDYKSTLFKVYDIKKRDVRNGLEVAFHNVMTRLGKLGHTFIELVQKVLLIFEWDKYLNLMEFIKYYVDNTFHTIWESIPILQDKMAHWVHDLKHDQVNTTDSEMHAKLAQNLTMDGKEPDPRTSFIKDHTLRNMDPSQLQMSLKDIMDPSINMSKMAFDNLGDLIQSPTQSTDDKHSFFQSIKIKSLNAFGNITTSTFPSTEKWHKSLLNVMNLRFSFIGPVATIIEKYIFKNRFELTLMNVYLIIGSIQAFILYFFIYRVEPISDADLRSISKAPHIMNVLHVWLKDPESGVATPYKEYRIRCILDWMPKELLVSLLEVIVLEMVVLPTFMPSVWPSAKIITQILYVFQAFLIVAFAFPLDYIESQKIADINRQLASIYPAFHTMWYLWNLTCLWHVIRPFMLIFDLALGSKLGGFMGPMNKLQAVIPKKLVSVMGTQPFMNIFSKVKAFLMGIPQIFCISIMIKDLAKKVHFNDPTQVTHLFLNSFSWWMDTMTMVNTLFASVDSWVISNRFGLGFLKEGIVEKADVFYAYAMLAGYFTRTLFMETRGIPGVFLYYKSYFITSTDPLLEQKEIESKIPENLHGFMSNKDPSKK